MSWKVYARFEPMLAGHSIYLIHEGFEGRGIVKTIELETLGRHGAVVSGSQQVIPPDEVEEFLRACMDAAWELGLRPTGFKDHTNELTAVRYHLEDMRYLVKVRKDKAS